MLTVCAAFHIKYRKKMYKFYKYFSFTVMNTDNQKQEKKQIAFTDYLPLLLCGCTVPISMFLWLANLSFSFFTNDEGKRSIPFHFSHLIILFRLHRLSTNITDSMVILNFGAGSANAIRLKTKRHKY